MTPQQEPDAVAHDLASKLSHSCMQRNHYEKIAKALLSQRNQGIAAGLEMAKEILLRHYPKSAPQLKGFQELCAQIEKVGKL